VTTARRLAEMSEAQRRHVLSGLPEADLAALEHHWPFWARADQLPPDRALWPIWRTRLLLGGRGSGKTRAAAEWVRAEMESGRRRQTGVIAPTADTLRRTCIEGQSGLLATSPPWNRPSFEPSSRRVVYPGGGMVHLFSAKEPDRLRGPNLDGLWIDELTSMANASECWDVAMMALRIPGPAGDPPVCVITTTPKPSPLLKAIMAAPTTVVTRARTVDNAPNLDASTLSYLQDKYGGTRLGLQELDAELIDDLESPTGAAVGVSQQPQRVLLSELRGDRGAGWLRPQHGRRSAEGARVGWRAELAASHRPHPRTLSGPIWSGGLALADDPHVQCLRILRPEMRRSPPAFFQVRKSERNTGSRTS
jgi:Terminase large subunit, T4likevirus-type, N-terminal